MHGIRNLKCLPEQLPDLLETYCASDWKVKSCEFEDSYPRLVVVQL